MWNANLRIIDKIRNLENEAIYYFKKVSKYKQLFEYLPLLLSTIDYKKKECNIPSNYVTFVFYYLDKQHIVDNWDKYILNRDKIDIIISRPLKNYYLIESLSNITLVQSNDIKDLYIYYNKRVKNIANSAILVKDGSRLIDVLENPDRFLKDCINRLMDTYNY